MLAYTERLLKEAAQQSTFTLEQTSVQSDKEYSPTAIYITEAMWNEGLECSVCYYEYSRSDRVPRMLHCNHTFCAPCLEKISIVQGTSRTVRCPFCRRSTYTRSNLALPCCLWVNTEIWDRIAEGEREKARQTRRTVDGQSQSKIQASLGSPPNCGRPQDVCCKL